MIRPRAIFVAALFGLLGPPAPADTVVAKATIRSRTVLSADDLALSSQSAVGALRRLEDAVGMEARVVLYAGRPVRAGDLMAPAVIERNQIVTLIFAQNGLEISAEGRALARGASGERIRVMNLASKSTVSGTVDSRGLVIVGPGSPKNQE